MSNFNRLFDVIMEDLTNSAATAFTSPNIPPAGSTGGHFPGSGDPAVGGYNGGDARWAFGKENFKIAKQSKPGKKGKKSKVPKVKMQRRNLAPSM